MSNIAETITIGVYVPSGSQLLDAACVDIFGTMSRKYMLLVGDLVPEAVVKMSQDIQIYWIGKHKNADSSNAAAPTTVEMTAEVHLKLSHDIRSPEVQPGKLDIILIPGPDPNLKWDKEVLEFLRKHSESEGTDVLSVCTGIYLCAEAGIIKGKTVCGPRGLQDGLKKYGANLVGEKYRWWRDGNFWSSGGVTNGNDLVAHYVRTSGRFATPPAELAIAMCEVGDRPQKYEQGQAAWGLGLAWQVLKAFLGLGKPGKNTRAKQA